MSGVETVFRATDPTIVDGFREWGDQKQQWGDAIKALCDDLFPGSRPAVMMGARAQRLVGIIWDQGEPVPDGWRLLGGKGVPAIFPKKTTKAGKALAERFKACGDLPDPKLPGMLAEWWRKAPPAFKVHYPAVGLWDGVLWVYWTCRFVDTDGMGHKADAIDLTKWERVKLSEFYQAKEAHEAEKVEA